MIRIRFILYVVVFAHFCFASYAQEVNAEDVIRDFMENIGNLEDAEISMNLFYETLLHYATNPLNINTASVEELLQLHIINVFNAAELLEYIKLYGELKSPYELRYVNGFTEDKINKLTPFICTLPKEKTEKIKLKNMLRYGKHNILLRESHIAEKQKGYASVPDSILQAKPNSVYAGSKPSLQLRYNYRYKNMLQWHFTADKDAGEPFFAKNNPYGFDFYSAHVQISNIKQLQKLVVGDFYAQFGQGLVLWQGQSLVKTADVMQIAKNGIGIKAYTGADENNFFRGAAASAAFGKLTLNSFVSYNDKDADIDSAGVFSHQYTTGLHNTAKTIADKDALKEAVAAFNASYRFNSVKCGVTAFYHRYNGVLLLNPKPYQAFNFVGNSNCNIGVDANWYVKKFHFFGECAMSRNFAGASVAGVVADIAPKVQVALLCRNYSKRYGAKYASAFAEGANTANESGVYFGTNVFPHHHIKCSFYFDVFHFPWLKYRVNSPSSGFDTQMQVDYSISNECKMYVKAKYGIKKENANNENYPLKIVDDIEKVSFRYNIYCLLMEGLNAQSRIEGVLYRIGGGSYESGVMAFQDIKYAFQNPQITLWMRYSVFNTDGYNTRIYAYEDDLLYSFSTPACYGNGSRWYCKMQYHISQKMRVAFKLSQTRYFDRNKIGSGLALIDAPHRTEWKIQVIIKV